MIDVLAGGLHAVATRSPLAYPLVFLAGVVTSIGPCAAPRYVAVAALVSASRAPWRIVAAFVTGLVGAYVAIGLAAGALGALWSASGVLYAGMALALATGGTLTLLRGDAAPHAHEHDARPAAGLGGTLLLGASSAFVVSPCCTPVVAAIAGLTATADRASDAVALLATFACGHALPVFAAGALGTRITFALRRIAASHAPAVVAGSLMLALAAYYGALA